MYIFLFFIGATLGSFLNTWVLRMRAGASIWSPRSACPFCNHRLRWHELIPIASYLIQKAQCRSCKKRIAAQYLLLEIWMGIVFLFLARLYGFPAEGNIFLWVRDVVIFFTLTFVFLYDLQYMEIPYRIAISSALVLFLLQWWQGWQTWQGMVLGAAIGGGFFLLQYLVSKGKWIGSGDIWFGALMGVILGWQYIWIGILLAYVIGAITMLPLVLAGKKTLAARVPFGTFLAIGTAVTMYFGNSIVSWYAGFLY